MLIASFSSKVYSLRAQENKKKRKENKMNNDLLKLIQDTKDSMINEFSKISESILVLSKLFDLELVPSESICLLTILLQ